MFPVEDELHAWLALAGGSLAARQRSRRLLRHFGGPLEVFQAGRGNAEAALQGIPCGQLFKGAARWAAMAERTRQWLAQSPLHHFVPLGDPAYPPALLNTPDPPLVLHGVGQLQALKQPAMAIVGSRFATPAGTSIARELAQELSGRGIAIVSGLAVGIDAAAHRACLAGAGRGRTIAVVASGLDELYPREHGALFQELIQQGLVLSEHPLGTPALPAYFPQRNRIIAGLGLITVVVEATLRSGSLITARLALESGRDVFAVPGHPSSPQSAGCNALIKAGAGLLESADDLMDAVPWLFPDRAPSVSRSAQAGRLRTHRGSRPGQEVRHALDPKGLLAPSTDGHADVETRALRAHARQGYAGGQRGGQVGAAPQGCEIDAQAWARARALLQARPSDLAELTDQAAVSCEEMNRTLLLAELDGLVCRLPGGLFQWVGPSV